MRALPTIWPGHSEIFPDIFYIRKMNPKFVVLFFFLVCSSLNSQTDYLIDLPDPGLLGKEDRALVEKTMHTYAVTASDTARLNRLLDMIELMSNNAIAEKYNTFIGERSEHMLKNNPPSPAVKEALQKIYATSLINKGYFQEIRSEDALAMKNYEAALKLLLPIKNEREIASAYHNIGYLYEKQNKLSLAMDYYKKGLEIRKKNKLQDDVVLSLSDIGYLLNELGEHDSAIWYTQKAIETGEKLSYSRNISTAYNNMSSFCLEKGDQEGGLRYLEKSSSLLLKRGDSATYTVTISNMAAILQDQGKITQSLDLHFKCLKIRERMGNKPGQATTLNNIGSIYLQLKNLEDAAATFAKCLKLAEELGSYKLMAAVHNNLGKIESEKGNREAAKKEYFKALACAEKKCDANMIAVMHRNIGGIYYAMNVTDSAEYHLNICLAYFEKIQSKEVLAEIYGNISALYYQKKDLKKAKSFAERSYVLAKELGYPDLIYASAHKLKDIYFLEKNYEKAYQYYNIYITMRDSIENEENRKSTTKKLMQYEYDKKAALMKADQEKRNAVAQAESRKQKIIIGSISLGLLFVLVLAAVIFNSLRVNRKKNEIISRQKSEVEHQKEIVEEKQKEIVDSIHYAQRIQRAVLASDGLLKKNLASYFLLFQPKDIVSGDFYWATEKNDIFYLMIADSTGHGVPGAFMSLLNISYLNEAITERNILTPDKILDYVRRRLVESLKDDGSEEGGKDGMDGTLLAFHRKTMLLEFACANNPLLLIRNNVVREYPADKMPVGRSPRENVPFSLQQIELQAGDLIYAFTDGFEDQFGGEKGKKFKYRQLVELITSINSKDMNLQKKELQLALDKWKGNLEQVDDITLAGIRI